MSVGSLSSKAGVEVGMRAGLGAAFKLLRPIREVPEGEGGLDLASCGITIDFATLGYRQNP